MDASSSFDTGVTFDELEPGVGRPIETPWGVIALFRVGERVFAVEGFCPHLEGPLFEGSVLDTVVTCPWHRWRFDLRTGERVDPAGRWLLESTRPLTRCSVRVGSRATLELTLVKPDA